MWAWPEGVLNIGRRQWSWCTQNTTSDNGNGATTLPRMNFSGYVGHVTVFR